jgi:hypothetical protein
MLVRNIPDLCAGKLRSPRTGTENRETGNRVTPNRGFSGPRTTGGKDDLPVFQVGIEGIAGSKSELSPDGTGKTDLPLTGNAGPHIRVSYLRRAFAGPQTGRKSDTMGSD